MTFFTQLMDGGRTIGVLVAAMTLLALIEAAIPLHARSRWNRAHLAPNLALTLITFATNVVFNAVLMVTLAWQQTNGVGLLRMVPLSPMLGLAVVVIALDFSFYVAHRSMHEIPAFWRVHRVHHCDPAVDVTTTVRQHPLEGAIRYGFLSAFAIALGVSPAAFAVYRAWSALNALLEHANVRVPQRLDSFLSLVVTTPNMHKVHHSRSANETDTNYGNVFAFFDRLLSTFTPSKRGVNITYGLDGFDDPAVQTTSGLLSMPFRRDVRPVSDSSAADTASSDGARYRHRDTSAASRVLLRATHR